MSRKFDRRQQIEAAAFEALKGSIRPKPRWMPLFMWRPSTWSSLESHLPWIDEDYQKRNRKHGDSIGGIHFHRRCVRE